MCKKCSRRILGSDNFIKMEKKEDDDYKNDEHHFLSIGNEMKAKMYGFSMLGINEVISYGFLSIIVKSIFDVFLRYVQGHSKY